MKQAAIETLQNLIAPGGRGRLSPYVESAQLEVLFGESPATNARASSLRAIASRNSEKIELMAEVWLEDRDDGKNRFCQQNYQRDAFLEMYLLYYFPTNVVKLQLSLLDLVRTESFQGELEVVDIGVGAGTTFIALLDFFAALACVCDLYAIPFPLKELRYNGFDRSPSCLAMAERVSRAYLRTFENQNPESPLVRLVQKAVDSAAWLEADVENTPIEAAALCDLLVASNVLNELTTTTVHFDKTLASIRPGATALVIEPGMARTSRNLMHRRRELLLEYPKLWSPGPCGQGLGRTLAEACSKCWNGRLEHLHEHTVYRQFRKAVAARYQDKRSFDQFENQLLSWSYVLLQNGGCQPTRTPGATSGDTICSTYIGRYIERDVKRDTESGPSGKSPDSKEVYQEYVKLCPAEAHPEFLGVRLKREPGLEIPPLRYGGKVSMDNVSLHPFPGKPEYQEIRTSRETIFLTADANEKPNEYLAEYGEPARRAVDELGCRLFGFPSMRPFQHVVFGQVLTGRSILAIAATGSGKSECFILPAIALSGVTIVVSPLKSLMQDQFHRVANRYGLEHLATVINGDVPGAERQARLRRMELGYYKLVYFTPEQLGRSSILHSIRRTNAKVGIRYLAFDEAHCISHWGHDFRPSYLNIVRRLKAVGVNPVRIALTATASPRVRDDLCHELELNPDRIDQGGDIFVESSNRPELNLIVRVCNSTEEKVEAILRDLRRHLHRGVDAGAAGGTIIFMPWTGGDPDSRHPITDPHSRVGRLSPKASHFASYLERFLQLRVALYHGKVKTARDEILENTEFGDLNGRLRSQEQTLFLEGEREIMVATKGFGMGIDKPDIRLVIHRTPPANLEAYVQEAGRAGRDGELADVVLYYSPDSGQDNHGQKIPSDKDIQDLFLSESIREIDVRAMRAFLLQHRRKTKDALYFTNDEIFDFLDSHQVFTPTGPQSYDWPEFVKRRPGKGDEYGDHLEILERGHAYQEKVKHIEKVLAALFRVRPSQESGAPLVFLEDVQETPATIEEPVIRNYDAILNASYDFGEKFRSAGMVEAEFQRLLDEPDLFKLAERLELDLRQLIWVLGDIKSIGGRDPELLRYQRLGYPYYGRAARTSESLKHWRDYAGAFKRASLEQANKNADRAGRKQRELDDWFGRYQVCRPKGWQVSLGTALLEDREFERFLREFIREYDTRSANKLSDYSRLLTDYVGVNEDGSLCKQADKRCLRGVLLGYLKTDEVVVGDSCYGCNHCVPGENFDRYPVERRVKTVQRVSDATIALLRQAEENEGSADALELVNAILKAVEDEEKRDRRLSEYLQGVTGRWLQDSPDHWIALWLRTRAMLSGLFPFQPREFVANLEKLAHAEREIEELLQLANQAKEQLPSHPGFLETYAHIARGAGDEALEELLLHELRENSRIETQIYAVNCRLAELHMAKEDFAAATASSLEAAHFSPSAAAAMKHCQQAGIESWDWSEVENELIAGPLSEVVAGGLLAACLKSHQDMVLNLLESDISLWKDWGRSTTGLLVNSIDPVNLFEHPKTARVLQLKHPEQPEITLAVLRRNPKDKLEGLENLSRALVEQSAKFEPLLGEPGGRWFHELTPHVARALRSWADCERWMPWVVADQEKRGTSHTQLNLLELLLNHAGGNNSQKALNSLSPICSQLFQDPVCAQAAHGHCRNSALQDPKTAQYYLCLCEPLPDADERADALIDELLSSGNGHWLWNWTGPSPTPRWTLALRMAAKLKEFSEGKSTDYSWYLTDQERQKLAKLFEYEKDPEEAEMLAAVLFAFWQKARDRELLAPLADTLVYAGLYKTARELLKGNLKLRIGANKLPLEELIRRRGIPESIGSINCDYQDLGEVLLRRWTDTTTSQVSTT